MSTPGLTTAEARRRLQADGPNVLAPERNASRLARLLRPLADPMLLLLLVALPVYLAIGDTTEAVVTAVALVPIAAIGWLLEARAERTLEQLRHLTAPTARVVRDDEPVEVPARDLVVGDRVEVREGDVIPADGAVVALSQLLVDEAPLTGESVPVAKTAEPGAAPEARTVWAGTTVLSGRAEYDVTATGPRTRYGQIGRLLAETTAPRTPLQRMVARLVRVFGAAAMAFCTLVVAVELARGRSWGDALIAGISLAIAAVPEEFPMVYTLYLALGAWRLAKDRALVRNLPGVETLGSTTVICTDKTGTLTEGRLSVVALVPVPDVTDDELLDAAVLACEPDPFDPLDLAIMAAARARGRGIHADGTLVVDHPFDPVDKYLTHVWRIGDELSVAVKGAVEGVLAHCTATIEQREALVAENRRLADRGLRVVAVGAGKHRDPAAARTDHESDLRLVGLVAFSDAIRDGVAAALAECRSAGVRVVMITGDHPVTAHAVAEGLDLPHLDHLGADLIATGDDLDRADEETLERLAGAANVFARIRPEQKHRLVQVLRARGEVVAMTGDGINDAPALREADIGVAMGERGTTVAREAATLVLLDDNFATIVTAIRDGRRIFDNLRRAFAYLVAFHPPLLLAALVVPLVGRPLLLLPVHLVVLEVLLHPAVSLVFEADPPAADVMRRPPRRRDEGLAGRALWRPLSLGLTLAGATLATYLVTLERGWPEREARATAWVLLLAGQALLLVVERSPHQALWRGVQATPTLVAVLAAMAGVTVASVLVGPVADLLKLADPGPAGWLVAVVAAAAATLWSEPFKARWVSRPADRSR